MRKRLIEKFTKCKEGSLGYTLTELLVVIGIIAIVCAIAIPSVVSISKSLRFAQRNDYAKSIFMAAQANLTEMRADGGLAPLQRAGLDSLPVQEELCGFPVEDWSPEYVYTSSEDSQQLTYALVLPVGSVDGTLREQQVIIEYNPLTGNVYAVFYSEEKDQNILQDYRDGKLPRNGEGDEKLRKDMMLGYYDGSGLSSAELEIERTEARITFENGEEGIVTVHIPMPDLYVGHHEEFMKGLEVKLDITGELNRGEIKDIMVKRPGQVGTNCKLAVDGKTVEVTYVLDSLANRMSFANLSAGTRPDPNAVLTQSAVNTSLTAILDESGFTSKILPGENVTLSAEVTFQAANDRPNVAVQNAKLGGVNPMFGYLTENLTGGGYTLTIENGRNLQNLNAIAPSVADQITAVVFTQDIYWNQTVAYYNQNYGTPAEPFKSPADEAPARALPYFVPIYNDALFGSAKFNYDEREGLFGITTSEKVPTLSDAEDANVNSHAKISGKLENGNPVRIFNLNIDATKYTVPNNTLPSNPTDDQKAKQGHYYVSIHNIDHPVNYEFTGLFAYVNTTIDNVHVVNPVVKGSPFVDGEKYVRKWKNWRLQWVKETVYSSPATGALVGASGYNTLITNCAAYVDTSPAASFDRSKLTQGDYGYTVADDGTVTNLDQNWYGVSGEGAVGGLVGYAKSHRTTTGALTGDTKYLAFSNCFAAVNVSGNMRGNENKYFGYTNGVGGLVGNSELTNFYKCYASGNVRANGCYVRNTPLKSLADFIGAIIGVDLAEVIQKIIGVDEMPELLYCGRRSMGAGGFVGTSHGTRYTNCFTTGNVSGFGSNYGAGGFVGIMSYEETYAYGSDEGQDVGIAQHTVFENCYAVGISRSNGQLRENFSGANARIRLDITNAANYVIGSYYRALAPYYTGNLWGSNTSNLPTYSNYYIFKDSYYLVQEEGILQDNTNRCATVESYDNLMRMHQKQREDEWIAEQIKVIKEIKLNRYETYDTKYFQKNANLETVYENAYLTGFPATAWNNINIAQTHPYSLSAGNQAYPFTMITGLDYYGDWPARPLLANIVYYEDYADGSTGYYFNNEDTATLKHDQDVVSAGYAIISANENDTVSITINNTTKALTCVDSEVYTPGGLSAKSKYYVFRIPADMYKDAQIPDSFYLTANVYVKTSGTDSKEAWPVFYFNPYTAISHLTNAAAAPTEAPEEVYIRTAYQLASLSRGDMDCVWDENTTIIQQLNIDAATYDWNGAAEGLGEIPTLSTIGVVKVKDSEGKETETIVPFNATYTGTGGYVAQAQIKGFTFAAPLFANVGDKGAVRSLAIEVVGGENGITIGKTTDDYTALVAAVCSGELENVDLTLTGSLTLNANTAAGLLAGYISGTEADRAAVIGCDIQADSLTVNATNSGTVLGQAEYCDIRQGVDSENLPDDLTLTLNNTLTLKGTDVGAYLGASGDLNGDETTGEVNVDGLTISLNGITADAQRLGALAGILDTGSIKNLRVTLDNAYSVTHNTEKTVIAGVAAVAKNALVQSVTVNVNGSLTGDTAAGVFGTAENLTVQTTEVNVNSTITGTQAAAGLAGAIEGGEFSSGATVRLKGTIRAESNEEVTTEGTTAIVPTGRAAGFAVEVHGQVSAGLVITETAGTITGNAEAAGFACEISAQVTGTRVAGKLNINGGKKAAGFAVKIAGSDLTLNTNGVTPALENTAEGYKKAGSNNNLTVKGESVALFAVEIGSGVNVRNCYVLGKLIGVSTNADTEPVVSGFAVTNGGAIEGCSANVTLSGGNAFVRENTGAISTSYGWYGDGSAENGTTTAAIKTGSVVSSYFVDIDVPVDENAKSAYIYYNAEYTGDNPEQTSPLKLIDPIVLENLNGKGGRNWLSGDSYGEYPYVTHIPAGYPYPQIRPHYGNWATPPRYAYGVLYFEKYEDEKQNVSWKLQIEELSLDGEATSTQTLNSSDSFDKTGNIIQAGYALFFKGDTLENLMTVDKDALAGTIEIPSTELSNISGYSFVKLAENATITITRNQVENETTTSVTVNTRYAHEFGTNVTEHIIRTEGQLRNVAASGSYKQTHDIALSSSFATIENFKGIYNGDGFQIQKSGTVNQWMKAIDSEGKVLNVDLNLGNLTASFFGNVKGEITLANAYFASVGENAGLISTLSGTMTCAKPIVVHGNLDGAIIGTVANNKQNDWAVEIRDADTASVITEKGAVIGTVNSGATVNLTLTYSGDISGSIVNDVKGIFTLTSDLKLGTVSGQLFDSVSGTVTLNKGITVATMAQNGSLVGNMATGGTVNAGAVDIEMLTGALVSTFTDGAVNTDRIDVTTLGGSLVNTFTKGTMTTGAVEIGTLNAPLVAAFNGGTLQGAAESKKTINVDTVGTTEYLIGETVGGTVKNYNATLDGNAGLAETLSGTMQSMDLTVNVDTMTVDVVNTFSGTTLENLTVTVNGNLDGSLVENASKTVKNLQLTVTGDLTEDVMIIAAAVEGLTVSVTGKMEGNGIGTAKGAVNTMSLTVTGNLTGSGIGTAEKTVNGLTITVGTGTANTMTGNAIGTAKGNVTTLNLTVNGTLKSSAIGTFSGTTLSGAVVKANAVAPTGTVNGILVNNNTGSITGSSVEAETITVTTSGSFGVIANSLASGKTMDATTVNVKELNLTLSGDSTIGGLIGENKGTINGCGINYTVTKADGTKSVGNAAMIIDNNAAKTAEVGGFVGVNSGTIQSGSDVKAKITYIQPASGDSVTIGGLVGKMSGGSLKAATVSGSIELTNQETLAYQTALAAAEAAGVEPAADLVQPAAATANGRSYIIGGAVGNAGAASVERVVASVTIGNDWNGAANETTSVAFVDSIANCGPVGMFVGYTDNGTFTDCFSLAKNTTYQFLGQTEITTVPFDEDTWTASVSATLLKAYSDLVGEDGSYTAYDHENAILTVIKNYTKVSANLDGCYFYWDTVLQEQKYVEETYYYTRDDGTAQSTYTQKDKVTNSLTSAGNISVKSEGTVTYSNLYYKIDNTDSYGLVTKTECKKTSDFAGVKRYTVTLYYIGSDLTEKSVIRENIKVGWFDSLNETFAVYSLNVELIQGQKYMVVSGNDVVGENGNLTQKTTYKQRDTDMSNYIFTYSDSVLTATSKHTVKLVRENYYATSTPDVKFTIEGLTLGEVTQFNLYTVAETPDSYRIYTFTPLTDAAYARQKLTFAPAPADLVIPGAATTSVDSDLPGESGEATQGTEVPEATGSNETATVPPAAEDGNNN